MMFLQRVTLPILSLLVVIMSNVMTVESTAVSGRHGPLKRQLYDHLRSSLLPNHYYDVHSGCIGRTGGNDDDENMKVSAALTSLGIISGGSTTPTDIGGTTSATQQQARRTKRRRPKSSSYSSTNIDNDVFAETERRRASQQQQQQQQSQEEVSTDADADADQEVQYKPPPPSFRSSNSRSTTTRRRRSSSSSSSRSKPSPPPPPLPNDDEYMEERSDPSVQAMLETPIPSAPQQQQRRPPSHPEDPTVPSSLEGYTLPPPTEEIKMPSLFATTTSGEELIYDRYSACLAATEGLRRARDAILYHNRRDRNRVVSSSGGRGAMDLWSGGSTAGEQQGKVVVGSAVSITAKEPFNPFRTVLRGIERLTSNPNSEGYSGDYVASSNVSGEGSRRKYPRRESELDSGEREEYRRACAQYVLQSRKVIQSLGLSVSQFNQLGREVASDNVLKERVMEQAYLYRMAATVNMAKIPLIEDPNSKQLLKSHRRRRVQMFVRSITEIEDLREEQMDRLKKVLKIDILPPGIRLSDPNVLPILSPDVRAVVEQFPVQAEEIVKKYGLNSDEFNQMLEETRGNPVFRWRVKNYMQKYDQLVRGFEKDKGFYEVDD